MNLDAAIRNALNKGLMSNAIRSNLGRTYELHAIHQDVKKAEKMVGGKVIKTPSPLSQHGKAVPFAGEVSFISTYTPNIQVYNRLSGGNL